MAGRSWGIGAVRGVFRAAHAFLLIHCIEPSVGSVGDSYDNALAETIIGLYKSEVINHLGPWRGREHVEFETLDWVSWFNKERLLGPIGNIPPAEFEAAHAIRNQPAAA